jgi:hypothetical protein
MHMTERIYGFWLPLWYLQTLLKDMLDCAQTYLLFLDQTILIHFVLNFLKNDGKMFKYYKRLDDVLMSEKLP